MEYFLSHFKHFKQMITQSHISHAEPQKCQMTIFQDLTLLQKATVTLLLVQYIVLCALRLKLLFDITDNHTVNLKTTF